MQIIVVKIGKPKVPGFIEFVAKLQTRLRGDARFEEKFFPEQESFKNLEKWMEQQKEDAVFWAMDSRGVKLSSEAFSEQMKMAFGKQRAKRVYFVIGGPYGFSETVLKRFHKVFSFSDMTFTSDLAWVILWEQLYRAVQIWKGTPYHHS